MINEFSIENFRVFRDKTTFKLKPLTILTGPNNSGKSTVNKALLLLKETFVKNFINKGADFQIPFYLESDSNIKLGKIPALIPDHSKSPYINYSFPYYFEGITLPLILNLRINTDEKAWKKSAIDEYSISYNGKIIFRTKKTTDYFIDPDHLSDIDFTKWLEILQAIKNANLKESITSDASSHNQCMALPIDMIHELEVSELSPDLIFFDDFLNNTLLNPVNYPLNENKLLKLAEINGTSINDTDRAENKVIDLFIDLCNIMSSKKYDIKFLNKRVLKYIENDFITISNNTFTKTSAPDDQYFMATTYNFNKAFNPETRDKVSGTYGIYMMYKVLFNNRSFGNFNRLASLIVSIFKLMITKFNDDLLELQYVPHIKLTSGRGIQRQDANWLISNITKFGNETYDLIKLQMDNQAESPEIWGDFDEFLFPKWLSAFGLSDFNISIEEDDNSQLIHIYINNFENGIKRHIADIGSAYAHIIILLMVMENIFKNVGLIIEEPEANLHPKFQSLLADAFVDYINEKNNKRSFIIETHSEYLIRKLQYLIAKGKFNPDDVIIYYIDDPDPNKRLKNTPQIREITIDKYGRMSQDFGPGFFDEADNIAIQLFNLNQQSEN